jgi:hypothetical protein
MPRYTKKPKAGGGNKKPATATKGATQAVKEVYSDDEGSDIERKEMARYVSNTAEHLPVHQGIHWLHFAIDLTSKHLNMSHPAIWMTKKTSSLMMYVL